MEKTNWFRVLWWVISAAEASRRKPIQTLGLEAARGELDGVCGGERVWGVEGAFPTGIKAPEIRESKAYLGNVTSYVTEVKSKKCMGGVVLSEAGKESRDEP